MDLVFFFALLLFRDSPASVDAAGIDPTGNDPVRAERSAAETTFADFDIGFAPAARPNPYNIGNCYQYKNCLGESIGNMWFDNPVYCKPVGGKSWMNNRGKCFNFPDGNFPLSPEDYASRPPTKGCSPAEDARFSRSFRFDA
ncbi:MAG: hypothetical protein LBF41_00330 [Deltaproteobacteria bacterium]|jgi:hypothetical protein|nr:hypothetical protein [Deltaproteobacteria bacterium]